MLAVGDALAAKGYAAISIDFPYHGDRTYCAKGGPISRRRSARRQPRVARAVPGRHDVQRRRPLRRRARQRQQARDVRRDLDMPVASGAMFLEIEHIANSEGSLPAGARRPRRARSLAAPRQLAGSASAAPVDTSKIFYAGQSLGGIMGAVFLGTNPDIKRAVLNVPGANLVPMFDDSTFFSPQLDAFFTRQNVERDELRGPPLPHRREVVHGRGRSAALRPASSRSRALLLQMATLDIIIPNDNTKVLEPVTHAPRRDYVAEHAFLTIPDRARVPARHARPRQLPLRGASAMKKILSRSRSSSDRRPRRRHSPSREQNAVSAATGGAGAARDDDAGAAWHDPRRSPTAVACASASRSRSRIRRSRRAAPTARGRPTASKWATPPHLDASFAHDRWAAGIALGVPFGGGVTWPATWPGATEAVRTELMVLRAAPFAAYSFGTLRVAARRALRCRSAADPAQPRLHRHAGRRPARPRRPGLSASMRRRTTQPRADVGVGLAYRSRTTIDVRRQRELHRARRVQREDARSDARRRR